MKRTFRDYLGDIMAAIEAIEIPASFKEEHQEIPWKEIAGMRDVLGHEYFGVDLVMS
jgi:hypothetical protein